MSLTHRQLSSTGRTCCICDRPCAILDCQCLENFQQNTSEHGNLMKRLTAAFSMSVTAKDLHSFSLCCSCEHHLVVIEQSNRIKECMKQVFIETREHRQFVNNHMSKHGKPPSTIVLSARAKRLSSAYTDSRSFDEASPRVKRSRVSNSSSLPTAATQPAENTIKSPPSYVAAMKNRPASASNFDDTVRGFPPNKLDITMSFDSVFLPGTPVRTTPHITNDVKDGDRDLSDSPQPDNMHGTNMELEENGTHSTNGHALQGGITPT